MSEEESGDVNNMRSRSRSPPMKKDRDDDDHQCIELKADHDEGLNIEADIAGDHESGSDGGNEQRGESGGDDKEEGRKDRGDGGRRGGSSGRGRRGGKSEAKESRFRPYSSRARVHISNLPFDLKWQAVKDIFREKVGAVTFVELFEDAEGKPLGCGVVEFRDHSCADKAISMLDNFEMEGRRIIVKQDSGAERDHMARLMKASAEGPSRGSRDRTNDENFGRGRQTSRSDNRGFRSRNMSGSRSPPREKWGHMYGLSSQFLEKLNITGPLSTSVFVASLDLKVTETKLYEVFRLAGHIVHAKLMLDKEGNSKGCAVIEYNHPMEAVQAISMLHRQVLYDRFMAVRMDRFDDKDNFRGKKSSKLPSGLKSIGNGLGFDGKAVFNFSGMGGQSLMDSPMNLNMGGSDMEPGNFQGMLGRQNSGGSMMRMFEDDMPRNSMGGQGMMRDDSMMMRTSMDDRGLGMRGNMDMRSSMDMGFGDEMPLRNRDRMMGGMVGGLGMMSSGLDIGGNSGGMGSMGGQGAGGNVFGLGSGSSSRDMDFGRQGGGGGGGGSGGMRQSKDSDFRMERSTADLFPRRAERGSCIVTVRNLPSSNTWQNLLDKFMDVGDVDYAEIISRGVGRVRFASEQNAQRAASLFNRVYFDGQMIEVSLD